jgi:hypothetical protein
MNRRDLIFGGSSLMMAGLAPQLASAAPEPPSKVVSTSAFGAVGDGQHDDTAALQKAIDANFNSSEPGLLRIEPGTYRITQTLHVPLTSRVKGMYTRHTGITAYGSRIRSELSGGNVLEVVSDATVRFLLLDGLDIQGTGRETHGLTLQCIGNGRYIYNFALRDVVVQGCGGDGLNMMGNIFEGQVFNSYFRDNHNNGATFGHDGRGGILSAIHVFGCVFGGNGGEGAAIINKAADVSFHGCYFLENDRFGLNAGNGVLLLAHCGFENNHRRAGSFAEGGAGLKLGNYGTLIGCTAYSIHHQTHLVDAYLTNHLTMIGCTGEGGQEAQGAKLAKIQGDARAGAAAILIGCRGKVDTQGIDPVEIGQKAYGAKFGSDWNSTALPRLGNYTMWIDKNGKLRIKNGTPQSDADGQQVGA